MLVYVVVWLSSCLFSGCLFSGCLVVCFLVGLILFNDSLCKEAKKNSMDWAVVIGALVIVGTGYFMVTLRTRTDPLSQVAKVLIAVFLCALVIFGFRTLFSGRVAAIGRLGARLGA